MRAILPVLLGTIALNACEFITGVPSPNASTNSSGGTTRPCVGDECKAGSEITLSEMIPSAAPPAGRVKIEFKGSGFRGSSEIFIAGELCYDFEFYSSSRVTCWLPSGTSGLADVEIFEKPNGLRYLFKNAFNYTSETPPKISSVSPASGSIVGGTTIQILGEGFKDGAFVSIDNVRCSTSNVNSSFVATCVTPDALPGVVSVRIQNPNGVYAVKDLAYSYTGVPTYSMLRTKIFSPRCTGCHANGNNGINLESYASISTPAHSSQSNANSVWVRINRNPGDAGYMPGGGPRELGAIKAWLDAGFPNN